MTKTTTQEIERLNNKINILYYIVILVAIIYYFVMAFVIHDFQSQINDLPKRVCWNETYNESEPILEQVTCNCAKSDSDYYRKFHSYCLMWCGKIIGYENITKVKEVCRIE